MWGDVSVFLCALCLRMCIYSVLHKYAQKYCKLNIVY